MAFLQKRMFIHCKDGIDLCITFVKTSYKEIVCDDFDTFKVFHEIVHRSLENYESAGCAEKRIQ